VEQALAFIKLCKHSSSIPKSFRDSSISLLYNFLSFSSSFSNVVAESHERDVNEGRMKLREEQIKHQLTATTFEKELENERKLYKSDIEESRKLLGIEELCLHSFMNANACSTP
jgi:hypothetical protein